MHTFWLLTPKFNFWKRDWALSPTKFEIWSMFPNFLRSWALSCSTACEATHIGSLSYWTLSFLLLVYLWRLRPLPTKTSSYKIKLNRIVWLSVFLFVCLFFFYSPHCIGDSILWERYSFGSKMLLYHKTINKQSWKFSKT